MQLKDQSYLLFSVKYAFRNLWRNSRRTTLTMSTVMFAVMVAIVANRYSAAIMKLWQDGAADTGSAHAQAHAEGYMTRQEGVQLDLTMAETDEFDENIRNDSFVQKSVRRLILEGIISKDDESLYFIGKGVEPSNERIVSPRLFTSNDEGEFLKDNDPTAIVVGAGLAESLNLKVGDEVTLITQTIQGSVNGIDARVSGIVDAAIPSFSKRTVMAHIKLLQKLIRMPDRYTELAIRLKPGVDIEKWVAVKKLRAEKLKIDLMGWWEVEPIIRNVGKIWDSVVMVITILLFLSTALSVLNIIFMMVAERTIEIGTLMAIGAQGSDVKRLFAIEASLIGMIGGTAGLILGCLAVFLMDRIGVPFESPFGSGKLVIHPKNNFLVAGVILMAAVAICYISSIAPARKASLVEPVKAFRGQIT
jgi:putative ABC transport system permease protein